MDFLAQVPMFFGAGGEKGWGPAPLERVGDRFAAQVPHQKSHLRQKEVGPAPQGDEHSLLHKKRGQRFAVLFFVEHRRYENLVKPATEDCRNHYYNALYCG